MAIPTAPTLSVLAAEGLKKAGHASPTSAQTTRAETRFMSEIKNDLGMRLRDIKSLQKTAFLPTVIGKHRYANPSDYGGELNLTLMYGTHTGTAQTGASGSITLAADEDIGEDSILGKYVLITSGTGAASCSQVTSYSTSTKIAGVTPNFETAPVTADGYMIVDEYTPLSQIPNWDIDRCTYSTAKDKPSHYAPIGDADDGEFILYPVPDVVYGLQMRYYADVMRLDLAGTTIATLYQRYENLWVQGVFAKQLQDDDDNRYTTEFQIYRGMLNDIAMREKYGNDLSNLRMTVSDY